MLQLELKTEISGDTARVNCYGRIVAGAESAELDRVIRELLPQVATIDLNMDRVVLLDSSGIGVLIRHFIKAKAEGKHLRLVAMSPQVRKTVELTNLLDHFQRPGQALQQLPPGLRLLFVHPSDEIRTFVSALLESRGAQVSTCESVGDASLLAGKEQFRLIIVPAELDSTGLPTAITLALERQFLDREAEDAAEELIAGITAVVQAGAS